MLHQSRPTDNSGLHGVVTALSKKANSGLILLGPISSRPAVAHFKNSRETDDDTRLCADPLQNSISSIPKLDLLFVARLESANRHFGRTNMPYPRTVRTRSALREWILIGEFIGREQAGCLLHVPPASEKTSPNMAFECTTQKNRPYPRATSMGFISGILPRVSGSSDW